MRPYAVFDSAALQRGLAQLLARAQAAFAATCAGRILSCSAFVVGADDVATFSHIRSQLTVWWRIFDGEPARLAELVL